MNALEFSPRPRSVCMPRLGWTIWDTHAVGKALDDDVILGRLRLMCGSFPEAEEAELQRRPLFHVRRRRFLIFNGSRAPHRPRWDGCGQSIHLLTDPFEREALAADSRFFASPHHGDRGWLALHLGSAPTDWVEVGELVETAYRQAAPGSLSDQLGRKRV